MRILLLGGTGVIGSDLCHELNRLGLRVSITTRRRNFTSNIANVIVGDAMNDEWLHEVLKEGWDIIVDFMVYKTQHFQSRYKKILSCTGHYYFLSSSRVFADSKIVNEDSKQLIELYDGVGRSSIKDNYAIPKCEQERVLRESGFSNWTILRPYITYGVGRMQFGVWEAKVWLRRALQSKFVVAGNEWIDSKTTLTSSSDCALIMSRIISNDPISSSDYNVVSGDCLSWREIWDIYEEVLLRLGYTVKGLFEVDSGCYVFDEIGLFPILYDRSYDRVFDNAKLAPFLDSERILSTRDLLKRDLKRTISSNLYLGTSNFVQEGLLDNVTGDKHIAGFGRKSNYLRYFISKNYPPLIKTYKKYVF